MTCEISAPNAKDIKRLRIMLAAEKMFAEKGYHKTTVEHIAKAAGIGKSTFYEYFASKDEVLRTAVDMGVNNFLEILQVEYKKCTTTKAKVFATIYCCLLVSGVHGDALQAYIPLAMHNTAVGFSDYFKQKFAQPFFGIMRNIFVGGMNSGEIAEQDADLLVHMLMGCVGSAIHYQCSVATPSEYPDILELTDCKEAMAKIQQSDFHKVCSKTAAEITELFWRGVGKNK